MGAWGLCTVMSTAWSGNSVKQALGDAYGQGLDEVQWFPGDPFGNTLRHLAVVRGVPDVVGLRGCGEVQVQHGVHHKRLALAAFKIKHAMMADGGHTRQRNPVHGSPGPSVSWVRLVAWVRLVPGYRSHAGSHFDGVKA